MAQEVSRAWQLGTEYSRTHHEVIGSEPYRYVSGLAAELGFTSASKVMAIHTTSAPKIISR